MIDTVRLGIQTRLPCSQEMRQDGFTGRGGGFYKNATLENGSVVKLHTSNFYGQEYFSVELSAPKMIYGNNVEMLKPSDLPFLLDTVSDIVSGETRIDFDANAAKVMAFHSCHNWKLSGESDAYAYLDEMKLATVPYKRREIHAKENGVDTVYWTNKSDELLIYPKHAETARLAKKGKVSSRYLAQSIGMLRLEHRYLTSGKCREIADRFGYSNRAGSLLPNLPEIAQEIIFDDMKVLGLDKIIEVTGERERLKLLAEFCGSNTEKFQVLSGFLHVCDIYGIDNLVPLGLIKEGTFRNRKTEIKRAGISLSKPIKGRLLAPLSAPLFENELLGLDDEMEYQTSFNKTQLLHTARIYDVQTEANLIH